MGKGRMKNRGVFWLKVIDDTLIKMGTLGIDAGFYKKVGNVHLKLRKDLGEWIQDPFLQMS